MKKKIILIGGATAVGKTDFAIKLAKYFNGEIINADSVQIYKDLNIGSAKPTLSQQQEIKHHLINICSPQGNYTVADFKRDADNIIKDLVSKKILPIVVGGSGFYLKSLLFPMQMNSSFKNDKFRQHCKQLAEKHGNEYLYNKLKKVDPVSAEKLHCNDVTRVIRALEIYKFSGKKKSDLTVSNQSEYDYIYFFINSPRKILYERINLRVDKMFEQGLLQEVEFLINNYGLTRDNQSMQAIGYKEFFDYFDNTINYEKLKDLIKINSRHYAKRQITWFKNSGNIIEISPNSFDEAKDIITNFLQS